MTGLTADDPTRDEKLMMLGTEYRLEKARFWSGLLWGILFWPLLVLSVLAWRRMADLRFQAKMLGARSDEWTKDPWKMSIRIPGKLS